MYALIKYVGTDVDRKLVKAALNKQARREAAQRRGAANDSGVRVRRHTHTLSAGLVHCLPILITSSLLVVAADCTRWLVLLWQLWGPLS